MSLRVTRPTVNLREKVNSLDHDIGAHGGALMRSRTPAETFNLVQAGRKNLVINGGMVIYQRGAYNSAVDVPNGNNYYIDRWFCNVAAEFNNEVEIFQNRSDIYPPDGFRYCMSIRCKTASFGTGSAYWNFRQHIEGNNIAHLHWGYPDAKPVSLQFWVRSNRTGSYAISMRNSQTDWSIVYPYTINQSNTWQHVKIENIPGATHESWTTGVGTGIVLNFGFGSSQNTGGYRVKEGELGVWQATGSTGYERQRDFTDRVDNQLHLTGVQLEEGSFCTPFEHRPYSEELTLCERYYERYWQNNNTNGPGGGGGDGYNTIAAGTHNGTNSYFPWRFRTQKRARPSVNYAGKFRVIGGASIANQVPDEFYSPGADGVRVRVNHSGSAGQAYVLEFDGANSSNGYLEASAEL